MADTIKQKVTFALPPNKLFKFYMDEKMHSEITGGKGENLKGNRFELHCRREIHQGQDAAHQTQQDDSPDLAW